MKNFTATIKNILKDESGQGATEYILLLVVVVAIAMVYKDQILGIVKSKIGDVSGQISGFSGN